MKKLTLITEKLKDVLTTEDLNQISETISEMVEESVTVKVEEEKKRIELLAEEYVEKQIAEGMEAKTEELVKEYDVKLDELESEIVENLDRFLDMEITNKISDDLIKKIAINETYQPIVEGIKSLFENQFIDLDVDGANVMKEKEDKITELEESAAGHIADKMDLSEQLEKVQRELLISEALQDLTKSEKERVLKFTENRSYSELKEGIDEIVKVVTESDAPITKKVVVENKDDETTDELPEEVINEGDKVADQEDGIEPTEPEAPEADEDTTLTESIYAQAGGLLED